MACFLFALLWLGFLSLSSALLEPISFPTELQECYEYRSDNVTSSAESAIYIQNTCYRSFLTDQMTDGKVWSGENLTQEGISYIDSLFRRILAEADEVEKYKKLGGRQRRQASTTRTRREVRSPGAYQPYVNCVQRLQTERVEPASAGRNTYQTLAAFHSGSTLGRAHNGPAFLPWHRIYLLLMETQCGAAIPYWESGLDHDMVDPTTSVLWSDRYFGNGDGEVMNGPFRDMRTILGTPLIRNYGTGNSALFTKAGVRAVLSRRRFQDISEPLPRGNIYSLERHHNGPHVWVGGHLSALNSATWDPVFFMHHAYVDAVWARFRQLQIQSGINPETNYPSTSQRGHRPNDVISFGTLFERVTNIQAMANRFANLVTYEAFPVCENNCNNSPDLYCDQNRRVCISRARANSPATASGFVAMGAARGVSLDMQSQALDRAMARGPLPVGEKFSDSPFHDIRNRPDNLGTARVATQIRRAHSRVRRHSRRRRMQRRRVRRAAPLNATLQHNHFQSVSALDRSFTNTFIIDGVVDIKRWVYIPVHVIYSRSQNVQGIDPTLFGTVDQIEDTCQTAHSGASKVFVTSNGLNYYGMYTEYAIIDNRQPVYTNTMTVGVKNPEYGTGETLFTAYDSCGRPCRPLCLTFVNGQRNNKGCSGAFRISTSSPQMYSITYGDALNSTLMTYSQIDTHADFSAPALTFLCDNSNTWPWDY
ncbi:tyrosinase-like protein 1 [Magallana gigas]|uniref:Tyrosinase copper-binding domain-containing protein n=1 Tax=Magallana gigas TaxID=29159 RepID=A0A8W8NF03_MAGGI|nr:tyrosinase-like protein 1 [Crassostrea gigas]